MASAIPEHLRTVTPRLVVRDGVAAIDFYRAAFGATELGERFTGPGGELIHAEVRIGDSVVMISDEGENGAPARSPGSLGGVVSAIMAHLLGGRRRRLGARDCRRSRSRLST
jgi:PhnB protein